jgi:hypothetical protein
MTKQTSSPAFRVERAPIAHARTRYPFGTLKPPKKERGELVYDTFFVPDPKKVSTLRSQASRKGKTLKRRFSVRLVTEEQNGSTIEGVRIYRIK